MKITLETLANSFKSIQKLSTFDLGSPKLNFKFMKVMSSAENEIKDYIKLRDRIVEEFRDTTNTTEIRIPLENVEKFNIAIKEAGDIEVELDWDSIDYQIDNLNGFTASEMKYLDNKFINIKSE